MTNITLPPNVISIGNWAFYFCGKLTSVTIPASVTNIGESAFLGCADLTNVTIPNGINSIEDNAFGATAIANISIPDSVTSIGAGAFTECPLTNVTIPGSVTNIGQTAFIYCTDLTSVTIPGSVISVGPGAFSECTSLTNVTIGDGVTSLGVDAFLGCTSLRSILVDQMNAFYSSQDGVLFDKSRGTLIEFPYGFAGVYAVPNGVGNIESMAFYACTGLLNVMIPGSVTNIGAEAFLGCTHLTSVTIPGSVASVGEGAFYNCTSLTGVFCQGNAPAVGQDGFLNDTNATVYYLSDSMGWSEFSATNGVSVIPVMPIAITVQPQNQMTYAGATVTFSVNATRPLSRAGYQWERNGTNLADAGNISGATTGTLTITEVSDNDAGVYSVVISNALESTSSSNAVLTVDDSLFIASQPQNETVYLGSNITFDVAVFGAPPFVFQWYFNGAPFGPSGTGTNVSCTLTNVGTNQAGLYSVIIVNGYGNLMSSNAVLTVIFQPTLTLQLSDGYPLLHLNGMLSNDFVVQYCTNVAGNWINLISLTNLSASPYLLLDPSGDGAPARFYRAFMLDR